MGVPSLLHTIPSTVRSFGTFVVSEAAPRPHAGGAPNEALSTAPSIKAHRSHARAGGLLVFVFVLNARIVVLVVIALLIDRRQLQRVTRNNLEVCPTLFALNHLALFHIVDVNIEWVVALRAYD
jgi:hypothetical protein